MTLPLFFTIARITIAGLLFWAASHPSLNSHLLFRLAIFAVAAWGIGRAIRRIEEAGLFLLLFYVLVAVAFNPFGFHVEKETWTVIDIASGILFLLSIFILDTARFGAALTTSGGKKVRTLISIVFGIAWTLFGAFAIYNSARGFTGIAKLKINGRETQARITRVTHDVYETTDANDNLQRLDMYAAEYTFQTEDGRSIAGAADLFDNPVSGLGADEFRAQYSNGFEVDKNNVIPLQVEYETANPANNRALSDIKRTSDTIFGSISTALIFGLCPVVLGFKVCKEHLVELITRA